MKKGTSFLYIFTAILGITFFSCTLKVEDTDLYDKPGVNVTNNQVTIIIPKMNTDTKYINVYRRDKSNDQDYNIGILYHPLALENDNKNYCYIDTLVTENHCYEYRCRYNIKDTYYYTEWSDTIEIKEGYKSYPETTNLKYQANDAYMIFEKTDYTIQFSDPITEPDFPEFAPNTIDDAEWFKPMLIISNGEYTQAFELSSLQARKPINLRGMLPLNFLDTEISIKGIVAQKKIFADDAEDVDDSDERLIREIIWTEPTYLKLKGAGSDETINVPSQTGLAGLDYSSSIK